eukprot:6183952-Pleurochrysis_carterae.AAC.1
MLLSVLRLSLELDGLCRGCVTNQLLRTLSLPLGHGCRQLEAMVNLFDLRELGYISGRLRIINIQSKDALNTRWANNQRPNADDTVSSKSVDCSEGLAAVRVPHEARSVLVLLLMEEEQYA